MSPLENEVATFFSASGPLASHNARYVERAGQTQMAVTIAAAIDQRERLVVEAGTGVGKTYAYLVPALLSGRRTLISTATKALQDQLFGRDLPAVCDAAGLPVRTALLKGRSSYLCQHRLGQARQVLEPSERYLTHWLAKIEVWAQQTSSGDMAEVPGLDERSPVLPYVTSTRENCLGSQCPQFRACHVNAARREALAADIVVVNHHLFFADVAVRESGVAELLPSVDLVVFDEAHQINEIGVQFLGANLSTVHLLDLARDTLAHGLQTARGLQDWSSLAGAVERAVRDLRLCVGHERGNGGRLRWQGEAPQGIAPAPWGDSLDAVYAALLALSEGLQVVEQSSPELGRLAERSQALMQRLQTLREPAAFEQAARWVEVGAQIRLVLTPLDVATAFQDKVLSRHGENGATWVFTSATLGTDEALGWFTQPVGLSQARTLRVASPFDYPRQAGMHVPDDLPAPSDPKHSDAVADKVWGWAQALGGRTLVLTTTLRAVQRIAERLTAYVEQKNGLPIKVLVQGQRAKRELLRAFEDAAQPGECGAVLVASASFWEGVDLPGDALQLVVIDKLPFPPPDDPLVEARSKRLEQQGGSAFVSYFLPEAAVALKQGAGRLIRSETDRGVLAVCDVRLRRMGYGKKLLATLPDMRWLDDAQAMDLALKDMLTTASTTAEIPPETPAW